jgi:predicted Fe-Mo cluster-binding NifX family protein
MSTATKKTSLQLLKEANATLVDTEEVGVSTLNALQQQGTKIKQMKSNTQTINHDLSFANKIMNKLNQWFK